MADDGLERSEEATPKKEEDARRDGDVAVSRDLVSVATLAALGLAAAFGAPLIAEAPARLMRQLLQSPQQSPGWRIDPGAVAEASLSTLLGGAGPLVLAACVASVVATAAQTGLAWSGKALEAKWERLDPVAGIKQRMVSSQALAEWLKSIGKAALAVLASTWALQPHLAALRGSGDAPLAGSVAIVTAACVRLGLFVLLAMAAVAVLDAVWQRHARRKRLMMSRDEIRREMKEQDGDPHLKAKRRQKAIALSRNRLVAEVSSATVIVTNPTHYAIALRYELGQKGAPRVVARGTDAMAMQIRAIARSASIPQVENRPLARALHAACREGQPVPPHLFEAVAEVLAFVFRLRQARGIAAPAPR
jgi:flagellar biosynthetic protein FlhB